MAEAVPAISDGSAFHGLVHKAARRTGGRVTGFTRAQCVTPNFHEALITYRDRVVAVVCSREEDASVAVAEPRPDQCTAVLVFVDEPELVAVLAESKGFRVLSKADVDRPFRAADHPHLWASDVTYWKPETAGQALFNWWD